MYTLKNSYRVEIISRFLQHRQVRSGSVQCQDPEVTQVGNQMGTMNGLELERETGWGRE